MKMLMAFILLFLWFNSSLFAQNLVPNPSFENVHKKTISWIQNKQAFESILQDWTSPNQGSPDVLFDFTVDKMHPPRKGVDVSMHQPRTGKTMVGIKTYGCYPRASHCREYVQIELKKSVESGEQYYVEFWVNPIQNSPRNNNLGMVLTMVEIDDDSDDGLYYFEPPINETNLIDSPPNAWYKVSGIFTADASYDYLLIGNFYGDDATILKKEEGQIKYAYYLLDDVQLRHLSKDGKLELAENDLEVGNTISLNNILFKTGKVELLPPSYEDLNQLLEVLRENKTLEIQINGYTDNQGEKDSNLILSKNRAMAVVQYLTSKGIAMERLSYQGLGEGEPIASNDDDEGRKLNRRVEFVILKN